MVDARGECGKKGVLTSPNTTSNSYNRQGQTQVLQMQAAGGSEAEQMQDNSLGHIGRGDCMFQCLG